MLICANPVLQQQLDPWLDRITASFAHYDELDAWLQRQLHLMAPGQPLIVELDLLPEHQDLSPILARLHVLSGHRPILLAQQHQFDSLPDTAMEQIHSLISLPLSVRQLELVLRRLGGDAVSQAQQVAHEQRLKQLMEENRELRSRLRKESPQDPITGLLRREALLDRLENEWRRAHRHEQPISAIAIRLEGLPDAVSAADQVQGFVDELARRLKAVRASDIAARFEADLFVVVLPQTFQEGAQSLAGHFRAILERLAAKYGFEGMAVCIASHSEQPRRHGDALRFLNATVTALDCAHSDLLI